MKSQTTTSVVKLPVRLLAVSDSDAHLNGLAYAQKRYASTQSGLVPVSLLLELCDEQDKKEERAALLLSVAIGLTVGVYLSLVHLFAFFYLFSL